MHYFCIVKNNVKFLICDGVISCCISKQNKCLNLKRKNISSFHIWTVIQYLPSCIFVWKEVNLSTKSHPYWKFHTTKRCSINLLHTCSPVIVVKYFFSMILLILASIIHYYFFQKPSYSQVSNGHSLHTLKNVQI